MISERVNSPGEGVILAGTVNHSEEHVNSRDSPHKLHVPWRLSRISWMGMGGGRGSLQPVG